MDKGLDYSSGRPGGVAIRNAGYQFVCRYLSHTPRKNLTLSETRDLRFNDISIVVVWETTAKRASQGRAAGVQDATDAHTQLVECGLPINSLVYFAVDYDAYPGDVLPYFQGVASIIPKERIGVYGGYKVVRYLMDYEYASKAWQTRAWSNGQWYAKAAIRQLGTVTVNGVSCDINEAMTSEYGQWSATEAEMTYSATDAKTNWSYKSATDKHDVHQMLDNAELNSGAALISANKTLAAVQTLDAKVSKMVVPTFTLSELVTEMLKQLMGGK